MKTEVPIYFIPFALIGIFCVCFFITKLICKTQDLYLDIKYLKEDVNKLEKYTYRIENELRDLKYKKEEIRWNGHNF